MKATPLADLRLQPRHHLSALWWLGLLYRRPQRFARELGALSLPRQSGVAACLHFHVFLDALLLLVLSRLMLFGTFELFAKPLGIQAHLREVVIGSLLGILGGASLYLVFAKLGGVSAGITFGIAGGTVTGLLPGIAGGVSPEMTQGVPFGVIGGGAAGLAFGVALGVARGLARGRVTRVAWGLLGGILGGVVVGVGFGLLRGGGFGGAFGTSFCIALGVALPRAFYLPVHLFFIWPVLSHRYRAHPVAWDDLVEIRMPGLHRLLIAHATNHPVLGEMELERLLGMPAHRAETLKAQAVLVARQAGKTSALERLPEVCAQIPEGAWGLLTETASLKLKIAEIARVQARLKAMDRPFLQGPTSQLLVDRIETFREQISGFSEPLASEFRAAARSWLEIARNQRDRVRQVLEREPTRQVFRAGDPVDRQKEAFVPRLPIFGDLEAQVMLATGCPGILLYGRRRMGKSTVLKNLPGFLPPSVRVVYVSMQNPQASTSLTHFTYHLTEVIGEEVPEGRAGEPPEDLAGLFEYLERLHASLGETDTRLLLGLDEFENLDRKIGEGVFPEDLLDTLRESIQTHRQITWVFAGSHSIDELDGAEWSSYLVSTRTVEVLPFTADETRLLLTEPLKHSTLWEADDPERPSFSVETWGERGIERIHGETGGWPHLVQLVAETLVDRMNVHGQAQVDESLFERSLDAAVTAGDTVFSQLLHGESQVPGEWEYLLGFCTRETQPLPDDDEVRRSLQRRLLVVPEGEGEWRLRAPLFARWLRKRG